ncbi:MAG: hypothetical protein ACK44H_10615 [Candidatus Kryptonium sp.]
MFSRQELQIGHLFIVGFLLFNNQVIVSSSLLIDSNPLYFTLLVLLAVTAAKTLDTHI